MDSRSDRSRRWSLHSGAVTLCATMLLFAGCADDSPGMTDDVDGGDVQEDAQPAPGVDDFSEGDFDDIPLPRGATEITTKTERDGAISQSFTVTATSPLQIMDSFSDSLPALGWQVVEPVRSTGTDSLAAAWVRDDNRLEISALLAQGIEDERTQFSIVLLPDRTPGEDINDSDRDPDDDGEIEDDA